MSNPSSRRLGRPTHGPCALTERERNYIFSVAMKYVKDEEAAADVTQDAMLLVHRHRDSFRGASRFSTWLYRVAATTALMHLRKQRRRAREVLMPFRLSSEDSGAELLNPPCPDADPEACSAAREGLQQIEAQLDRLGEKYRDVFRLRFVEGYTESEIAERLKLNVATVKTRAYRARLAVRASLDPLLAA